MKERITLEYPNSDIRLPNGKIALRIVDKKTRKRGGYIQSKGNVSLGEHESWWIYQDAYVQGDSYVDKRAKVGTGTHVMGESYITDDADINPSFYTEVRTCIIRDSRIESNARIQGPCDIINSTISTNVVIGSGVTVMDAKLTHGTFCGPMRIGAETRYIQLSPIGPLNTQLTILDTGQFCLCMQYFNDIEKLKYSLKKKYNDHYLKKLGYSWMIQAMETWLQQHAIPGYVPLSPLEKYDDDDVVIRELLTLI